jgi:6-methylsalicylate decarboxylase
MEYSEELRNRLSRISGTANSDGPSRRELLVWLGTAAAATMLRESSVFAQSGSSVAKTGRIDVHYHLGGTTGDPNGVTRSARWTPKMAIEDMDRVGTAAGIISASAAGAGTGSIADRNKQAREFNDRSARLMTDHPGRFGLWTRLPLTDIDASLKEIEYGMDTLKADGIGLVTSYEDMWLGDPKFKPVWQELNRRKAIVYVHPNDANCCGGPNVLTYQKQNPPASGSWFEYPMNTARTIFSLMMGGVVLEMPDIKWIFSHSGGVAPMLLSRIEGFVDWDSVGTATLKRLFPQGITNEFGKLYFEVAQGFSQLNMDALMKVVPATHLFYGSDYPVFPLDHTEVGLKQTKLPDAVRRGIERDNILALLPRWKA